MEKFVMVGAAAAGSLCLTIAVNGDVWMVSGIFWLTFAVMTSARYPYHD